MITFVSGTKVTRHSDWQTSAEDFQYKEAGKKCSQTNKEMCIIVTEIWFSTFPFPNWIEKVLRSVAVRTAGFLLSSSLYQTFWNKKRKSTIILFEHRPVVLFLINPDLSWTALTRKEPSIRGIALWMVLFCLMLSSYEPRYPFWNFYFHGPYVPIYQCCQTVLCDGKSFRP
jgi:hypothetical protein